MLLGHCPSKTLRQILRINIIANNPVIIEDIKIAKQIFGSDIAIPKELYAKQQDIVLYFDGIKVNGMLFLTTVSKNIFYRTAQYVESKSIS
jgi:hypothetical protein